jgi:hypothetical protein
MLLQVQYQSGSQFALISNASDTEWRVTQSPITFDNIYVGEVYGLAFCQSDFADALLEQPGWDTPAFTNATAWSPVAVPAPVPKGVLSSPMMPPIRITDTYTAIDVYSTAPGVYMVCDGKCSLTTV